MGALSAIWSLHGHGLDTLAFSDSIIRLGLKRRTGKGQYIDHSQLEAGISFLSPAVLDFNANKRPTSQPGNRDVSAALMVVSAV